MSICQWLHLLQINYSDSLVLSPFLIFWFPFFLTYYHVYFSIATPSPNQPLWLTIAFTIFKKYYSFLYRTPFLFVTCYTFSKLSLVGTIALTIGWFFLFWVFFFLVFFPSPMYHHFNLSSATLSPNIILCLTIAHNMYVLFFFSFFHIIPFANGFLHNSISVMVFTIFIPKWFST